MHVFNSWRETLDIDMDEEDEGVAAILERRGNKPLRISSTDLQMLNGLLRRGWFSIARILFRL